MCITYDYAACTVPETQVSVSYIVDTAGTARACCHYRGQKGPPQLPLFGLCFTVPLMVDNVRRQERSGETHPGRKKGGVFNIWESPVEEPGYPVPQEHECHVSTHWVKLYGPVGVAAAPTGESGMDSGRSRCLEVTMEERPLHSSVIPYIPQELESALRWEEFPVPCRTMISVLGAIWGVGDIDS